MVGGKFAWTVEGGAGREGGACLGGEGGDTDKDR